MDKQPNSRICFVCGIDNPIGLKLRFYTDGEGRCIARFSKTVRCCSSCFSLSSDLLRLACCSLHVPAPQVSSPHLLVFP